MAANCRHAARTLTSQLVAVRQLVSEQDWQRHYKLGRTKTVEELLVRATPAPMVVELARDETRQITVREPCA